MRYSLWDMNLALPRVSAHAAAVVLLAALVALIATAAVYEVMFDIRVIGFPAGADTGASPRFQTTLLEAAFLAMTSASLGLLATACSRRASRVVASVRWLWLVPIASVALFVSRYYAFDSYYSPHLIRISSQNSPAPMYWWLVVGAAVTAATIALAHRMPRLVVAANATVLLLAACSTLVLGAFH